MDGAITLLIDYGYWLVAIVVPTLNARRLRARAFALCAISALAGYVAAFLVAPLLLAVALDALDILPSTLTLRQERLSIGVIAMVLTALLSWWVAVILARPVEAATEKHGSVTADLFLFLGYTGLVLLIGFLALAMRDGSSSGTMLGILFFAPPVLGVIVILLLVGKLLRRQARRA